MRGSSLRAHSRIAESSAVRSTPMYPSPRSPRRRRRASGCASIAPRTGSASLERGGQRSPHAANRPARRRRRRAPRADTRLPRARCVPGRSPPSRARARLRPGQKRREQWLDARLTERHELVDGIVGRNRLPAWRSNRRCRARRRGGDTARRYADRGPSSRGTRTLAPWARLCCNGHVTGPFEGALAETPRPAHFRCR